MKPQALSALKKLAFSALAALALPALPAAHAASQTWGSSTTGNWTLGTNWVGGSAPGATSGLTNADVATFSDAAGGTITIDSATQNIGGLLFNGTPGAYIIGASGANAGNSLLLSSGGTINVTSSNAVNQTVNAPLVLEPASGTTAGSYTIQNNNSSTGALIIGGNITGGTTTQGITLTLGGTNTSASNLVSGRISDGAATLKMAVTKSGTGTWTLSGNNTYSGNTTVSLGTLKAGSATGISASSALNVDAGIFDLNGFNVAVASVGAGTSSGTITNSAASGTNTLTITNFTAILASLITDGATAKTGLIVTNSGGTPRFTNANNTFSGGLTLTSSNTRIYQDSVSTTLNGNGTIQKSTFGTGTINIGSTGNTGNAQLAITSGTQSIYNPIVFNAAGYLDGGKAAIRADGGGLLLYGQLTAGASDINISAQNTQSATAFGQLTSSGANGLTLKTPGNGSGTFTLTLSNNGTLGANNYTGNTTLQTLTTLALGLADQIPNGAGKGNLVNSGNFKMGGFSETINGLSGNGTVDGISGTPTLTVGDNDQTSTFSGVIKNTAGTLALTKIGTGTLTLSGNNTYGGATQVNAGLLLFANTGAKSSGTTVTTVAAASIGLGVGGTGFYSDANVAALFNTNTLTGFNLAAGSGVALDTTAGNFTQTTGLTTANHTLTKLGSNTLTLSGTNTYNGTTTISAGTLKAGSTTGLSPNSAFSVAAGATLDLGGFNNTISSLATSTGTITDSSAAGSGGTLLIATALPGTATPQLFTGSLGLQIFGGGNTGFLSNTANTYSGGTILGNGLGATTRWLSSGTIGTTVNGTVTSGIFGTGTITIGASASDNSQIYCAGATTINNAIVVNTILGASDFAAFRLEQGPLTINGTINANLADVAFSATNGSGQRTATLNNTISGISGLQVSAGGATLVNVILNNTGTANSYAGNTAIDNGNATLTLGAANQIPNGAGKGNLIVTSGTFNMGGFSETINGLSGNGTVDGVSGTPTLTVGDNSTTSTFSGVIKNTAGTLALTKIGTGTLTLSGGSNTYSGGTTVTLGTLSFANGALGSSGNITVNGGTLQWNGSNTQDISSRLVLQNAGSATLDTNGNSVSFASVIGSSSNSSLTKAGAGTLTLSGNNTYSGNTTVSAGTLQFANSGAGNSTTSIAVNNAGTALAVNYGGGSDYTQGQVDTLLGKTSFGATTTAFAFDTTNGNGTYSTAFTRAAGLTKLGANALTLSGNNTYTGNTTVSAGTLKAGSTTALTTSGTFSVAAGATLDLAGFHNTISSLSTTANGTVTNSAGSATLKVTGAGATTQLITGNLALQLGGTQNIDLTNGNNTFSGGTTIGLGNGLNNRILLTGSRTIGTLSNGTVTSGQFGTGAITLGTAATDYAQIMFAGTATINNAIVVNSALGNVDATGTFRVDSTGNIINGTINANLANATFHNQAGIGAITLNGAISGTSGLMLTASSGTSLGVTLANTGTATSYAGDTTISSVKETLTLGAANQIPNGAGKGNLIVTGGSFKMGGFSETINGLSGNGTVDGISGTPTLTVGDGNATSTFSGVIKNTAGTLAVTKTGTGTLTLSGNNTYSGATNVTGGTLQTNAANALGSTSGITIATGGTLLVSANASIGSTTTITMNSTTAGNGTAAALVFSSSYNGTVGSLTLNADSIFDLGSDPLGVRVHFSSVTLNGHTLSIYNWTGTTLWGGGDGNNTDQIYAGNSLGTSDLARVSFYSGLDASSFLGTAYQITSGSFINELGPVPEPSTWVAMAALALTGTTMAIRRRTRQAKEMT